MRSETIRLDSPARPEFHPELRRAAFLIPRFSFGPRSVKLLERIRTRRALRNPPALADVSIRDEFLARGDGSSLRLRVYSPAASHAPRAALLWIHGGGFIMGHPEHDEAQNIGLCRDLGMVVLAVNYRLGPQHPFPEPLDDCHDALAWLHANAAELGIDSARIAVGGASAGAGLAAGLALLTHDRRELPIAFQLLIYPMIDDRTALRGDIDHRSLRVWSAKSNHTGWQTYLGHEPGGAEVPSYAAPARRHDLSGLPPAWIGVGTCDLFMDEDITYAARLNAAGVSCALEIVDGAFHAFDLAAPASALAANFRESWTEALRRNLKI